jgi:hypothetical protein
MKMRANIPAQNICSTNEQTDKNIEERYKESSKLFDLPLQTNKNYFWKTLNGSKTRMQFRRL